MDTRSGKKPEPPPPKPVTRTSVKDTRPATRTAAPVSDYDYELDVAFPMVRMFQPQNKLPTLSGVAGMLRYQHDLKKSNKGGSKKQGQTPAREVAKVLYAKWYHDTLPCKEFETLVLWLTNLYPLLMSGSRDIRRKDGKKRTNVEKYKELVRDKDKLYDIFEEDKQKRTAKEAEWGVQMGKMEELYLEDMRGERKMTCGGEVDPVWYQAVMKRRRQKEKEDKNKAELATQFQFMPLSEIEDMLDDEGELVRKSSKEIEKNNDDDNELGDKSDKENNLILEDVNLEKTPVEIEIFW